MRNSARTSIVQALRDLERDGKLPSTPQPENGTTYAEKIAKHEDSADTFAAMSRAQAAATVMSILDTMDEDKRIVFALVELEQLSVPEVARMLELNLNTAYSRLRLARAAFELPPP